MRPRDRLSAAVAASVLTLGGAGMLGAPHAMASDVTLCGTNTVNVPEGSSGVGTGTYLTPGRSLAVQGAGAIWAGYLLIGLNGPGGFTWVGGAGYPAPSARADSLVGRVGAGPWQYIGSTGALTNTGTTTEPVQFVVNDNVHGNGSGAFGATYTTCDDSGSPASQYSVHEMVAAHSGKCLDVTGYGTAAGTNIQQWTCHGTTNQQWTPRPSRNGYFQLVARNSGECLDVADGGSYNSANVRQMPCAAQTNQEWSFVPADSGRDDYAVVLRSSGRCLDVSGVSTADGANVFVWDCLGGANQEWHFQG